MITGHFYYIKDEFYDALPGCGLMTNKPDSATGSHGRPCHYCFEYDGHLWMVPISSQLVKYEEIYNRKVIKYGECDSIVFGFVNGQKRAFLIQNAFPITQKYVENEYCVQHNTVPVVADDDLTDTVNKYVRKVIRLYRRGIKTTFTDIKAIMDFLDH